MGQMTCNFISYVLKRAVDISVILPTLTTPEMLNYTEPGKRMHEVHEKYPLLILLHGGMNDYSTWQRYTSIERYAEERRIAVVMLSGENKMYVNAPESKDAGGLLGNGDNFYDFVRYEIPDFISANFPISTDPKHTYMAGLSMGGMGTMLHAFSHPEDFRAVGIFSASANLSKPGEPSMMGSADPKWDNAQLLDAAVKAGKKLPEIYTACGKLDFGYENWVKFTKWMDELGVKYTADDLDGYAHEWAFWDIEIVKFLDWIPRDDYYYLDNPKRKI